MKLVYIVLLMIVSISVWATGPHHNHQHVTNVTEVTEQTNVSNYNHYLKEKCNGAASGVAGNQITMGFDTFQTQLGIGLGNADSCNAIKLNWAQRHNDSLYSIGVSEERGKGGSLNTIGIGYNLRY